MALAFVRSASAINQMTDIAFFAHYGETSRVVGFFAEPADTVASRIFELHRRHAAAVCRVFDAAIASHAPNLREGSLPADCLLSLVVSRREGGSIYPVPSGVSGQVGTFGQEIRMAIDIERKRVVFNRWGELAGVSASLIIALANPFRQAVHDELAPEHYPFTESTKLMRQTGATATRPFGGVFSGADKHRGVGEECRVSASFARRGDREHPVARLQVEPGSDQDRGGVRVVRRRIGHAFRQEVTLLRRDPHKSRRWDGEASRLSTGPSTDDGFRRL